MRAVIAPCTPTAGIAPTNTAARREFMADVAEALARRAQVRTGARPRRRPRLRGRQTAPRTVAPAPACTGRPTRLRARRPPDSAVAHEAQALGARNLHIICGPTCAAAMMISEQKILIVRCSSRSFPRSLFRHLCGLQYTGRPPPHLDFLTNIRRRASDPLRRPDTAGTRGQSKRSWRWRRRNAQRRPRERAR